jgi:hypothetical protein
MYDPTQRPNSEHYRDVRVLLRKKDYEFQFQYKLILSHDIHLLHLHILSLQTQYIKYTLVITRLISVYKTRCTVRQ